MCGVSQSAAPGTGYNDGTRSHVLQVADAGCGGLQDFSRWERAKACLQGYRILCSLKGNYHPAGFYMNAHSRMFCTSAVPVSRQGCWQRSESAFFSSVRVGRDRECIHVWQIGA